MTKTKHLTVSELADDIQPVFNAMDKSSDTVCVILAASFVDRCLANALINRLPTKNKDFIKKELYSYEHGILGTYSSRNKLAYLLKIVDDELYNDISLIGKIRNRFAHHHKETSFNDEEIKALCNSLHQWEKQFPPGERNRYKKSPDNSKPEICRLKFIYTATDIVRDFVSRGLIHKIIYKVDT